MRVGYMCRVWCHVGASFLRGRPGHSAATGATHEGHATVPQIAVGATQCTATEHLHSGAGQQRRQGGNCPAHTGYSWTENQ